MTNKAAISSQPKWIHQQQWFSNRFIWHLAFWIGRLLAFGIIFSLDDENYNSPFIMELYDLPSEMIAVYFCLYVLLPYHLLKKRYTSFFFLFITSLVLAGFLKVLTLNYLYYPFFNTERLKDFYGILMDPSRIGTAAIVISSVVFLAIAIKLLKHWYQNQLTLESLEKEKLEAELKFLKAQVHPHFLFNTLNSIYGLALKKSNTTPEIVLKLSGLLNYMLYDGRATWVGLQKELTYVEDYIALEQMRYGERLKVSLQVSGEPSSWSIAPMLILSFVENCFKHGVSGQTDQAWIKIQVEVDIDSVDFFISNSKSDLFPHENGNGSIVSGSYKAGIGLQNVKRRLDLIYGEAYELEIDNQKDRFSVFLHLGLNPQSLVTEDLLI